MGKLSSAERRERIARWLEMPATAVASGLDQYGDELRSDDRFLRMGDQELERALLTRKDRLITLALARNASDREVLAAIFKSTQAHGSSPDSYMSGLRAACFGNRVVDAGLLDNFPEPWMDQQTFAQLIQTGDQIECEALLTNPLLQDSHLVSLYKRTTPFDAVDLERWRSLVLMSARNPRLVRNEDSEEGPDLGFDDIQRAILDMLANHPLDDSSAWVASSLLEILNPFQLPPAKSAEAVRKLLDSWRNVTLKGLGDEDREGFYTDLPRAEEMRCLVASYYGRALESRPNWKSEWIPVGQRDSPDLALRCAAYGKGEISPAEIKTYFARDKTLFTLAVLSNLGAFSAAQRQVLEEECLQGRELVALYGKRCKQCAEEWPSIDPRPVSETGQQLLEGIVAAVPPPPNNTELTLTQLSKSLTDLTGKLTKIRTIMLWGFAIMIVLTLFRYHV